MPYSANASWQIDGETMETLTDFILWGRGGLQNHCAQWLQQPSHLKIFGPWKEGYEKPRQHIKKKNHHFANKGPYHHIIAFPVVMYGCKSRTIMKAEEFMFSNCDAGEDS